MSRKANGELHPQEGSMSKRPTQCERILEKLEGGEWVSNDVFLHMEPRIASLTRRISDLRGRGHIIQEDEEYVKGVRHTKYQLIELPKTWDSSSAPTQVTCRGGSDGSVQGKRN